MIEEWLAEYNPKNEAEIVQAFREIVQETALCGLYRSGFFEKAAFYGGTALRIFHGLPRYSEDLDFSLLKADNEFDILPYLNAVAQECESLGLQVTVHQKEKNNQSAIASAFLKSSTLVNELNIAPKHVLSFFRSGSLQVKVKLEIDTQPPLGFRTEERLLLRPISCYIKCFTLSDLFAGKMHALLFRKWKTRVKGRDWFDMEWYIKKGIDMNINHFNVRALQSGDIDDPLDVELFRRLVDSKIAAISIDRVKEDAKRFVADQSIFDIWSKSYFSDLAKSLKISHV